MLSITVTSKNDPEFFRELTLAEKMTIGRDAASNIYLPDPDKHISRLHAIIECRGGNCYLTVTSKINPLVVNDKFCPHGQSVILADGDRIVICSYILTVSATGSAKPAAASSSPRPDATTPPPWAKTTAPSRWVAEPDPFGLADLMAKPTVKSAIGPDPFAISTSAKHGNRLVDDIPPLFTGSPHELLESNLLDPMEALGKLVSNNQPIISGNTTRTPQGAQFDDLLHPFWPSSQDNQNIFGSNMSSTPLVDLGGYRPAVTRSLEHVHDINLPYTPPPAPGIAPKVTAPASTAYSHAIDDPFADTLKTYLGKNPASPANLQQNSLQPGAAAAISANEMTPSVAGTVSSTSDHTDLLLNAFRNAAGLSNQSVSSEDAVAYMESVGTIVRAAIEGIVSLLASRSMLKGELGAEDRTMVASRDNNPLKFMPDIQDAMQFLFENKKFDSGAYLSPVQSISGACKDLIYHEAGTAAGMRAAVEGSISRFNPRLIEAEFDKSGKKLVLNRKAALWEVYVRNYKRIEASMADNVGQIFERDFRLAYDDQIRKLKRK